MSAAEPTAETRALYFQHARSVRSLLRRLTTAGSDMEWLLQEVFVVAIRQPRALLAAEVPRLWLYGVAVKVAANARRQQRLKRILRLGSGGEALDGTDATLSKLPDEQRDVLVLFELQGLSGEEIAQVLGCPQHAVWARLHQARAGFAKRFAP